MRAAVDDQLFEAVVAHERAHLAGGHHRLVWLARLARLVWLARLAGLLQPLLWPVIGRSSTWWSGPPTRRRPGRSVTGTG